ncbi:methyl-accepting chemotaxis sensory transducer with Cache sensor [Syntrophobotulus glycolicus DSM 8271]|uniref:Methyl-accepting chemotaxis sensory transducer with Cache sensor n=1 Tax=Syntrophobotulus glycolicus (strain DSM 8271 / FlGlyR) TaxID=645991 RepID=F0SUD4_SYNGF|nr:methyl-accepting chemotaxis protein [Syntrophobotulus glycolicus]ADY56584.1 methyl-accepting chemotaxis sensory transducer with Cache sensor [Syntrophobotulus glycolicus DSM 8271]
MSIKYKIIGSFLICVLLTIAIMGCYEIFALNQAADDTVNQQYDQRIKIEVEICIGLIDQIYDRQIKGELTEKEAKKLAADTVRDLQLDGDIYFWIDTIEGQNIVLSENSEEGSNRYDAQDSEGKYYVRDFINNGLKEEGGYTDYTFPRPGQTEPILKRAYTLVYEPYHWVIGTGNYIDDINEVVAQEKARAQEQLRKNLSTVLIVIITALIFSTLAGIILARRIANPIIQIAKRINALAEGNLDIEKIRLKSKDEIGQLAEGFNRMSENLKNIVHQIKHSSNQCSSASEQLSSGAEELAATASSVSDSVSDVVGGTVRQIESVSNVNTIVEEINHSYEDILNEVQGIKELSDKTSQSAQQESEHIDITISLMNAVEESTRHAQELINHLGQSSKEIGLIVETISGIAEQTNLLALNAAIEAARAGEYGQGFAVVADEVRKLAEQSQEAAKKISNLIKLIQENTEQAVTAMNEDSVRVKEGTDAVNYSGNTFKEIIRMINDVAEKINVAVINLSKNFDNNLKIVKAVNEVDTVSQHISAQTQTIGASAQEQTAASQEIASSAQLLMKNALEMQELMQQFKLETNQEKVPT